MLCNAIMAEVRNLYCIIIDTRNFEEGFNLMSTFSIVSFSHEISLEFNSQRPREYNLQINNPIQITYGHYSFQFSSDLNQFSRKLYYINVFHRVCIICQKRLLKNYLLSKNTWRNFTSRNENRHFASRKEVVETRLVEIY